jgi:hypothetical protein
MHAAIGNKGNMGAEELLCCEDEAELEAISRRRDN